MDEGGCVDEGGGVAGGGYVRDSDCKGAATALESDLCFAHRNDRRRSSVEVYRSAETWSIWPFCPERRSRSNAVPMWELSHKSAFRKLLLYSLVEVLEKADPH